MFGFFFCLVWFWFILYLCIGVQNVRFLVFVFSRKKRFVNNGTFSLLTFFLLPLLSNSPPPIFFLSSWFENYISQKINLDELCKLTIRRFTSKGNGPMLTNSFKYMHVEIHFFPPRVIVLTVISDIYLNSTTFPDFKAQHITMTIFHIKIL